jgi:hypothetical protein
MRTVLAAAVAVLALSGCSDSSTSAHSSYTTSQQNAIQSAQEYLSMDGFSRGGLIHQLTAKSGDGFPRADSVFAVNHVKADWDQEAVQAAREYLSGDSFSRSALIHQLTYDQFTQAQARYAANHVGLTRG